MPNQYPGGTEGDGLLAGPWACPVMANVQNKAVKHNSLRITQVIWFKFHSTATPHCVRIHAHNDTEANVATLFPKRKKKRHFIYYQTQSVDAIH
jgi:hypothetical protein